MPRSSAGITELTSHTKSQIHDGTITGHDHYSTEFHNISDMPSKHIRRGSPEIASSPRGFNNAFFFQENCTLAA